MSKSLEWLKLILRNKITKTKDGGVVILFRCFFSFRCLKKKKAVLSSFFFFLFVFSISTSAKVIQFPDQELASEYVFPVFKKTRAVLNRKITLSKRFEIRFSGAFRTDEPLYNPFSALASLSFYWSEFHGIGVSGLFFFPGYSKMGEGLKTAGIKTKKTEEVKYYFDAGLAPHPLMGVFLNYQFSPLYGKISITKKAVLSFALYTFFGAGALGLKHGDEPLHMIPAIHFGLGQRFYFNRYFALDGGLDMLLYRGPNPVLSVIRWEPSQSAPPRPSYSEFTKQDIFLRFLARVGLTILL